MKVVKDLPGLMLFLSLCTVPTVFAQTGSGANPPQSDRAASDLVVDYPAAFFARYRPNTALDMVEQLPGFRPDDGSGERGYGSSVGNILIDGRRPASKQDAPTDILDRIPAAQVAYIELIRGPVRDIELLGATEVVNVVLLDDVPALIRWEASVGRNSQTGRVPYELAVSLADLWRGIEFNTGLDLQRYVRTDRGVTQLQDAGGRLIETRDETEGEQGVEAGFTLGASTWFGATLLQFTSQVGFERGDESGSSIRARLIPVPGLRSELFEEEADELQYEFGLNAQRSLNAELGGKLILLYNREQEDSTETQISLDESASRTGLRSKDGEQIGSEAIARLEFDWSGWEHHLLRLNIESAWNLLDNTELEIEDEGSGPQVVSVPGANTRVEEQRWDIQLKDTWISGRTEFDYGLAVEASTITQTGDAELERDFFYIKPHLLLTRTLDSDRQLRGRVAREVAQLDFGDFVSASVFEDDDLALGNPDLRPETTWVAEIAYEQRYADIGMIGLTLFHHWIDDVQDLLPLTDSEEVPGNIGSGRRWGIVFESTVPLDRLGMADARLDIEGRWQDSSVTDPVTGQRRVLSATGEDWDEGIAGSDTEYTLNLGLRQDIDRLRFGWGVETELTADGPRFKVNELDTNEEGLQLDAFIETSRWFGVRLRLEANNLLDQKETRERLIYAGLRDLSPLERRQFEPATEGRELRLSVSGSF